MDITLAEALDDLCALIHDAADRPLRAVHVAPRIYDLIAQARGGRGRGRPSLLLGLDLVRDAGLRSERFAIH